MHDRVPRLPPQDGRRTPASPPSRKRGTLAGRAAGLIGGSIVALAGAALFNGARARAAVRANPPRGRFVDIDGVAIHYVEHGAGPPLVLIHGNGSMIQDFELSGIVGPLAETHRVVIFDRPGSGYSSRPGDAPWTAERQAAVLVAAADRLGLVRPVVVGHSWGTLPALHWALDHGEKISALVLMSGYYFPSLRLDVLANAPTLVPVLGGIVRQSIAPILGRMSLPLAKATIFAPATPTPAFVQGFPFELALRPSQILATEEDTAQMVPSAAALTSRYQKLRLPVAIVAGDGDKIVDFAWHSKQLAGAIHQARLVVVAGVGHMVHHSTPDRVVAAIRLVAG